MLYHIFGSMSPNFKTNIKNDLAKNPENFESCVDDFDKLILSSNYTDIYFVVDLGVYKPKPFEVVSLTDVNEKVPFLVISEYHIEDDISMFSSKHDNITINLDGFRHVFNDNKSAIEKFTYYIDNKIQCYISYENPVNGDSLNIISVRDVLSNPGGNIKRFRF